MVSAFGVDHGEVSKGFGLNAERGLQAVTGGRTIQMAANAKDARAYYAASRLSRSTAPGRASKEVRGGRYSGSRAEAKEWGPQAKRREKNALWTLNRTKPGRFLP